MMRYRWIGLLVLAIAAAPLLAHEGKKYKLTFGDGQSITVTLEEIPAPAPQPDPTPTPDPTPEPPPVPNPPPPVDPPPAPTPDPVPPPPAPVPEPHPTPEPHDHGVMVMDDAVMMGKERTPRFAVGAESIAVKSGDWSNASTWTIPPTEGSKVQIPEGLTVTYDVTSDAKLDCIEVSGCLDFSDQKDTELWATEIMVLPSGCLCIEPGDCKSEIVFPDGPLRTTDVSQSGRGLIAFGEVRVAGKPLTTFTRLADDVEAGSIGLQTAEPVDWPVGSEVLIPDTRQDNPVSHPRYHLHVPQYEIRKVSAVNGNTVTLDQPLTYAHRGPRDYDGTPTKGFDGKVIKPHAACLSRSVVFRSENPKGTRGHVQLIANAKASIKHAEFRDLGRTKPGPLGDDNHIGRYALHCHHLVGRPNGIEGYQFVLEGNSVVGGLKWGITVHDSHYGLIRGNVVYDVDGAGIATEIGSETGNLFDGNFVCRINGQSGFYPPNFNGLGALDRNDLGDQGAGYWFPGPMNAVRNNVACNCYQIGFNVWPNGMPTATGNKSSRPVMSPVSPLGEMVEKNLLNEAVLDFRGNEVYGATTAGVFVWETGNRHLFPSSDPANINTLTDTTVWHVTAIGSLFYYADEILLDGWIQRGDPNLINKRVDDGTAFSPSVSEAIQHGGSICRFSTCKRLDIQGCQLGYFNRGHGYTDGVTIDGATLDNPANILVYPWAQWPEDGSSDSVYKDILFKDSYSPGSLRTITMDWNAPAINNAAAGETHRVVNYQRIQGLNLELYYRQQIPGTEVKDLSGQVVIPKGRWAPVEQDGDKGEKAIARGKALGIDGLVFVTSKPAKPLVFANVLLEDGKPVLYYAVLGDDDDCVVTVNFRGSKKIGRGALGNMPLDGPDGLHPLSIECDCGASFSTKVQLPVRK